MKYTIEAGEDRASAATLHHAMLIAGEFQINGERRVTIERTEIPRRRWKATLQPSGVVRLDLLYRDENDDKRSIRAKLVALKAPDDVKHPDSPLAERERRVAIYAKQWETIERKFAAVLDAPAKIRRKFERGLIKAKQSNRQSRPLVPRGSRGTTRSVLNVTTGKTFRSVTEASEHEGIRRQSMLRRLMTAGSGWFYVDAAVAAALT